MNTGQGYTDIVKQLRLYEAGINYTELYMLGMSGKGMERYVGSHGAFNQIHPRLITSTGMTVFPHTPLADMATHGEFTEVSEREKTEELRTFLEILNIDVFYDYIHHMNPVNYFFSTAMPRQSDIFWKTSTTYCDSCTNEELELMVSRQFRQSL